MYKYENCHDFFKFLIEDLFLENICHKMILERAKKKHINIDLFLVLWHKKGSK